MRCVSGSGGGDRKRPRGVARKLATRSSDFGLTSVPSSTCVVAGPKTGRADFGPMRVVEGRLRPILGAPFPDIGLSRSPTLRRVTGEFLPQTCPMLCLGGTTALPSGGVAGVLGSVELAALLGRAFCAPTCGHLPFGASRRCLQRSVGFAWTSWGLQRQQILRFACTFEELPRCAATIRRSLQKWCP